jgi:hypothetical protein
MPTKKQKKIKKEPLAPLIKITALQNNSQNPTRRVFLMK